MVMAAVDSGQPFNAIKDLKTELFDHADLNDLSSFDRFPGIRQIRTLAEYLEAVHAFLDQHGGSRLPSTFLLYRGQPGPYPLVPKLLRPNVLSRLEAGLEPHLGNGPKRVNAIQSELVLALVKHAEQYRSSIAPVYGENDFLSWLCLAQHHGLPTCFLDWAANPLASLFFACDDVSPLDAVFDGVVWGMILKDASSRSEGSVVRMDRTGLGNMHRDLAASKKAYEAERTLVAQINTEMALSSTVVIIPRVLTRRIEAQSGAFLASPDPVRLSRVPTGNEKIPWATIAPICVIPQDSKPSVLEDLRTMRIHHGSVYADLDSYARSIVNGLL